MASDSRNDPVVEKGMEIFRAMESATPPLFDRNRWTGRILSLVLEDRDLKVRLFRFIDAFPSLANPDDVARHLRSYFLTDDAKLAGIARLIVAGASSRLSAPVSAFLLRRGIVRFSRTFIAGASVAEATGPLRRIRDAGRAFTADLLGEAAVSEDEAIRYADRYVSLIEELAAETAGWDKRQGGREALFPAVNVSVKISSLYSRIGPVNHEDSVVRVKERLRPVFRKAMERGAFVNLDMETRSLKEITLDVFTGLLDEREFSGFRHAGVALQAYLKECEGDLVRLAEWARERKRRITVRLVKGAYWEHETISARQRGWPVPVFSSKSHTDWNFERCAEAVLDRGDCMTLAAGTHNVRSIARVATAAQERGIGPEAYEFQMLYGMAGPVKDTLGRMGYGVREYVPIGELLPGMAYLVRRLLENSSNEGFLRKRYADRVSPEELLAAPESPHAGPQRLKAEEDGGFANEPPADFSRAEVRAACREAIARVRGLLGREYPAVVAGRERGTGERIVSRNPASPEEVVGVVSGIGADLGEEALLSSRKAHADWAARKPGQRADILFKAARIARGRRMELMAWEILEAGKSWAESDADVTEAIDYLEYYGREAIRLGEPRKLGEVPGEENLYFYRPRGVGLVIAPWNFPLAISIGMASAALAAGNAVLYKPSSLTPVIGWLAFSLLREAGVPEGVLHFVPGRGEVMGRHLVEHRETDFIVFTGSRDVGLSIVERAAKRAQGQRSVKRVVAEMGGKNAIIVDADADLDQAVPGVIQSAFGYQGQKCSACSRVIVHRNCRDRFLGRLFEAVRSIAIGSPEDPACFMGPVIDGEAKRRILEYVELAKKEGSVFAPLAVPDAGHYVSPAVVTGLPRSSRVLCEEIFGPVLSIVEAGSMEDAVAIANDSEYALTGGLFSRSPASIGLVRERFLAGNLYINRGITGAIVGRQPFGGFRMSGVGSKAGGPDYMLQFMEPRAITENTMRRGFSPDVIS